MKYINTSIIKSVQLVLYALFIAYLFDWGWGFLIAVSLWSLVLVLDVVRAYREYRHTKIKKENEKRIYAKWPTAKPPHIKFKSE